MSTKTLADIRTRCYSVLKVPENSSAYPSDFVDDLINRAQRDICNWSIYDPIKDVFINKPNLSFLQTNAIYTSVQDTTVATALTIWATSAVLTDSSSFSSTWAVYINWNIIPYTWNAANTLTWASNVLFAHWAWEVVNQLYSLPSNFQTADRLIYNALYELTSIDARDITKKKNSENFYTDNVSIPSTDPFYSFIEWTYILVSWINTSWKSLDLKYQKKATDLTTDSTIATIPDDYSLTTIPYIAVSQMLALRWEEERAMRLQKIWANFVQALYKDYSKKLVQSSYWTTVATARNKNYLNI